MRKMGTGRVRAVLLHSPVDVNQLVATSTGLLDGAGETAFVSFVSARRQIIWRRGCFSLRGIAREASRIRGEYMRLCCWAMYLLISRRNGSRTTVVHGAQLTSWLIEHAPGDLMEIADLLVVVLD